MLPLSEGYFYQKFNQDFCVVSKWCSIYLYSFLKRFRMGRVSTFVILRLSSKFLF